MCVCICVCVYSVCVYKICKYNGLHWQQKDINNSLSEVKKLMVYMYFNFILKCRVVECLSVCM